MKILVINSGSSSVKYQLFQMPEETVIAKGLVEKIGEESSFFTQKSVKGDLELRKQIRDHEEGINFIIGMLTDHQHGVICSVNEIFGIGHRVVHGGEEFSASVVLTEEDVEKIQAYADLAPLHNPPNIMGIRACMKFLPHAAQVAVFDTAFHHSLPSKAYLYALPYEIYEKYRIRKYGFHGTSHRYVARRAGVILNRLKDDLNVITCHLGNGCSIAAVEKGRSVDTSMGFTPLEGLVMGTRCGDLDPAVIFYLEEKGYSVSDLNNLLNKRSGLLGISGVSNDMRNLLAEKEKGNERAALAVDIFCYRIRKYIGAYMAVLGVTHGIVFTGGIGENNPFIRGECLSGMESMGIAMADERNKRAAKGVEAEISRDESRIKVLVIPTNEELSIAQDTYELAHRMKVPDHADKG